MRTAIQTACNDIIDELIDVIELAHLTKIIHIMHQKLETEKQQHEQTAIHITNVLMDTLDDPKGGKFSVEDEFNKYWEQQTKKL